MKKAWVVCLKNYWTGKTRSIRMPAGLHEPEALRGACLKAGPLWKPMDKPRREGEQLLAVIAQGDAS